MKNVSGLFKKIYQIQKGLFYKNYLGKNCLRKSLQMPTEIKDF